jgi:uncharacterized short protein YbdD (DUF466 family)
MHRLKTALRQIWQFVREMAGEDAYARFCSRAATRGEPIPSQTEFYLSELERKHSRPNRCC